MVTEDIFLDWKIHKDHYGSYQLNKTTATWKKGYLQPGQNHTHTYDIN